jgi:PadR family transcriptional regulator, regulatory protein PadR
MYAELRRCAPERPAAPLAQLVILGAGFDTRAWRLEALAGATVFDVDHAVGGCGVTVYLRPKEPIQTAHGHTIAHVIERRSEDVLLIEHGSLYPALHRLEDRGWIASFWGTSENNRKARYYRLTASGRKQLNVEMSRWERVVRAVNQVLRPAE